MKDRSEITLRPGQSVTFDPSDIDAIFADFDRTDLPGVCVGIAHRGQPLYRKGFGLAHMELPVVLSPAMRMRIGSISKQFTCLAYMLLCERGLGNPDDPIEKFLPEFPAEMRSITMRHLMGNTSGIRDVTDLRFRCGGFEGSAVSSEQLLHLYTELHSVDVPPGTTWMYNNGGFIVLSAIIEKLSEEPLERFMRQHIFEPLGMNQTALRRWDTDFMPNSATPHTLVEPGRFEKRYWGVDFAGAGGIVSTVDDLLIWLANMDAPRVGSETTWQEMRRPQQLANGTSTGYGLGLILNSYRGTPTIQHGGGWIGGNAQVIKAPEFALDVVVIANRSDAITPALADKVLDACLPGLEPGPRQKASDAQSFSLFRPNANQTPEQKTETQASPLIGNFWSPLSHRVIELKASPAGQIVAIDGHDLPYELRGNVLHPTRVWDFIKRTVTVRDLGDALELELHDFGNVDRFTSLSHEAAITPGEISGRYAAGFASIEAQISGSNGNLVMVTSGAFGSMRYALLPLGERIWRVESSASIFLDSVVEFAEDASRFWLSSYNTRRLLFQRVS